MIEQPLHKFHTEYYIAAKVKLKFSLSRVHILGEIKLD